MKSHSDNYPSLHHDDENARTRLKENSPEKPRKTERKRTKQDIFHPELGRCDVEGKFPLIWKY